MIKLHSGAADACGAARAACGRRQRVRTRVLAAAALLATVLLHSKIKRQFEERNKAEWHSPQTFEQDNYFEERNCTPMSSFLKLEFHNTYWQTLRSSYGTYLMYGAYLDTRMIGQVINGSRDRSTRSHGKTRKKKLKRIGVASSVRILTVLNRYRPNVTIFCQLRFPEQAEPQIVRTLQYVYMWRKVWGRHHAGTWKPYLVTCAVPRGRRPASVSLVERPCDVPTNNLTVHYDPLLHRPRHEFAVCVRALDFLHKDISVRLVEWIELVRLLGAHKIFFYKLQVHRNIFRVLRYYERLGVVSVIPTSRPDHTGPEDLQVELIALNDCLYRNMYRYRWLVLLDVDEVIVPLEDNTWSALMRRVLPLAKPAPGKRRRSSYYASNLYFLDSLRRNHSWEDGVPRYMHMLQHVYRTRNFTIRGDYVKAFHETERVLALHNHLPLSCVGEACSSYWLPPEMARLQHYRADCVRPSSQYCQQLTAQPVVDRTLWRWRGLLVLRTNRTLRALSLLPSPHTNINNTIMVSPRPAPMRASAPHPQV